MWVARSGSNGVDYSVNAVAVPIAGLVQLLQINAHPRRNKIGVQPQSPGTFQVTRDDGTDANVTSLLLEGPNSTPGVGQAWDSDTFKGRVTVYGPAGATVAAYED